MKKNLFYYLFAVICTIGLFTSCSDDDEKVVNPIPQTTFNSENGLQLTYNGAPLLGKKVTFTPDATEATKATLRLEGEFDLSGILKGQRSNMTSPTGPGVFPGSPVTTLSVDLSINGNQCTFSGVSETEYCTFSYAGKVTAGTMDLSFTDVTLKNTALAGTVWKPTPLANTEDGGMDEPIHFVWKSGTKAAIEIFPRYPSEIEINDLLLLALRFPLFDDGSGDRVSVEQMLCSVLKDVTLGADGNIVATYMDAANGGTEWVTSPSNIAQYVVTGDNQLLLFLNPQAIMANVDNVEKSVRTVDVGAILQQAIAELYPMLINGVPLTYTKEGNRMKVFLGTDLLLPLMKNIVAPLFEDEEFLNMVIEAMKSDPQFGGGGNVVPTLKLLPEIIKNTTQLEIGLDLTQVK